MNDARKTLIGRPRGFDADEALERAMVVFWEQGYEGASLTDLTSAMGITKTSMYAAFGNKDELFRKALERYAEGPAAYVARALGLPTAWEVATAFLAGAVDVSTRPDCPAGCLSVQGSLATGDAGRTARDSLAAWREEGRSHLRDRFQRAVDEGDLPPDADPALLARYLMTMANGIAVQAVSGAGRDELQQVAAVALGNWPVATGQSGAMPRTDTGSRVIAAPPERVYAALVDPDALQAWLPPDGMSGRFDRFDARPGGSYRLVLTYADASGSFGKATPDSDVVEARFVDIVPGVRVVQAVDFVSDDPSYAGTMTMTWEVTAVDTGRRVEIRADDVPDGISAEDHATGLASSLANLAAYLQKDAG